MHQWHSSSPCYHLQRREGASRDHAGRGKGDRTCGGDR